MGKKRKTFSSGGKLPKNQEPTSAKLALDGWEDVADSEDEFHLNRDKILLDEGPAAKRRRRAAEEEALLDADDYEVLGLLDSEDDEDESDYDVEGEDYEYQDDDDDMEEDDDNVYKTRTGDSDDERAPPDEPAELEKWGDSRRDYYGADQIETNEEALEEQQEARRIESKQLEDFTSADADFDLDYDEAQDDADALGLALPTYDREDKLPEVTIPIDASEEDRLAYLRQRYPIFEPLSQEFAMLHKVFLELKPVAFTGGPVAVVQHQTLATYLGLLSMYFGLLTSVAVESHHLPAMPADELEKHPILEKIMDLRDAWGKVKDLKELPIKQLDTVDLATADSKEKVNGTQLKEKRIKKMQSSQEVEKQASLLRRKARLDAIEADLAVLGQSAPVLTTSVPVTLKRTSDTALGDEEDLTQAELAEKAHRRRNLGFYTSQIVQKASKRGVAGREAGGDNDIPHRERWRDRQARFQADAEAKRARASANALEAGGADGSDEDYQDLVSKKAAKVEKKQRAREAWEAKQAETAAQFVEEIGTDGKRKVNYQIEKNKGLAPYRKKEARNPRVKKRKKFEEKKKKLGSVRRIYKGGQGGAYGGELTGIKSNLIRGTRL